MRINKKLASIFIAGLLSYTGFFGLPQAKASEALGGTITWVDEEEISIRKRGTNECATLYFEIVRIKEKWYENDEIKEGGERKIIAIPGDYKIGENLGFYIDPTHSTVDYKDIVERFASGYEPVQKGAIGHVDGIQAY